MFSSSVPFPPKPSRFVAWKSMRAAVCAIAASGLIVASASLAYARLHGEIIDVDFAGDLGPNSASSGSGPAGPGGLSRTAARSLTDDPPTYVPGDDIQLHVTLTDSPETVTVYSDPDGAVFYEGEVDSTDETITVPTALTTSAGNVTIYATTGEGHVGSTVVTAAP